MAFTSASSSTSTRRIIRVLDRNYYPVNEVLSEIKYRDQRLYEAARNDGATSAFGACENVTSELSGPAQRVNVKSPIVQFPDSDIEEDNVDATTFPIEIKSTRISEETVNCGMEISEVSSTLRKRRVGRQENGNIFLSFGRVVSLGDDCVNETGTKRPSLLPLVSTTGSEIPDKIEPAPSSVDVIQKELEPGRVLVNIRNFEVSTSVDVRGFDHKRLALDSEIAHEIELTIKKLLNECIAWDVKDEGSGRENSRKSHKPFVTKREIADRQMFNELSYFDVDDDDVESRNVKSDRILPTSPLASDDFTRPLTVAAVMLVSCPVCIKKYSGSKILYLSPCQHPVCRSCFLTLRDFQVDHNVRCPLCKTVASEAFMFYRSHDSIGRLAHFSALPRKEV